MTIQQQIIDELIKRHRVKLKESAVIFKETTGRDAPDVPESMEEFAALFAAAATRCRLPGVQYFFVDIMTTVKRMMIEEPEEFLKQLKDENFKL